MAIKPSKVVKGSELIDSKKESDTIRLWENYKDQAILWRSIALLQIPATFICAGLALALWLTRSITLNVPPKPLPGQYLAQDIPDSEFIDAATDFINLIASYQPTVARRQFMRAREMTMEPLLGRFNTEMMGTELKAIENTARTQLFFPDPTQTEVIRDGTEVHVKMLGERLKYVAGRELPPVTTRFVVTLTTVPRHSLNPYGIVVINVTSENMHQGSALQNLQ
jgi:hypothetical protein